LTNILPGVVQDPIGCLYLALVAGEAHVDVHRLGHVIDDISGRKSDINGGRRLFTKTVSSQERVEPPTPSIGAAAFGS